MSTNNYTQIEEIERTRAGHFIGLIEYGILVAAVDTKIAYHRMKCALKAKKDQILGNRNPETIEAKL
ncbi:MAG: hypothetical protein V1837_08120 [Candidatus Woesearchaeota archaeon]